MRQEQQYEWNPKLFISIHAPTWGATCIAYSYLLNLYYFNPRTHVGCDFVVLVRMVAILLFQSTHPRGVRLSGNIEKQLRPNFNPRTHVGCDSSKQTQVSTQRAFQSTHPRGVRLCPYSYCFHTPYFNPRTHVGCDLFRIVF